MTNTTIAQEYAFFADMIEICKNSANISAEIEAEIETQTNTLNEELALIDAVMVPKRVCFLSTVKVLANSAMANSYEVFALLEKARETFELLELTCEHLECGDHDELLECFDCLNDETVSYHVLCNKGSVNSKMIFGYLANECYHLMVKINPYAVNGISFESLAKNFKSESVAGYGTLEALEFV